MPAPCGGLGVFVGRAIRLWWGTGSAAPGLRSVSDTNPSATAAVGAVLAGGGGVVRSRLAWRWLRVLGADASGRGEGRPSGKPLLVVGRGVAM